jgi:hypothetical protein
MEWGWKFSSCSYIELDYRQHPHWMFLGDFKYKLVRVQYLALAIENTSGFRVSSVANQNSIPFLHPILIRQKT